MAGHTPLLVCGLIVEPQGARAWVAATVEYFPFAKQLTLTGNGREEANFRACEFVWDQ
jgi:hypothetical protein